MKIKYIVKAVNIIESDKVVYLETMSGDYAGTVTNWEASPSFAPCDSWEVGDLIEL